MRIRQKLSDFSGLKNRFCDTSVIPSFFRPMRTVEASHAQIRAQIDIGLVSWSRDLLRVERRMAKKPVATASDVIDALRALKEEVGRLKEGIEGLAKAVGLIKEAVAKNHPVSHVVPDKRYTIPELR